MVIEHLAHQVHYFMVRHHNWVSIWILAAAVHQHLTELTGEPHSKLDQTNLVEILLHGEPHFSNRILVKLWCRCNDCDNLRNVFLPAEVVRQSKDLDHCIDVPFLVWCVFLADLAYLVGQFFFEFNVGSKKVVGQLLHDRFDIGVVSDLVDEIESLLLDA